MGVKEIIRNAKLREWLVEHRDKEVSFVHTDAATISGKGILRYDRVGMRIVNIRIEKAILKIEPHCNPDLMT